MKHAHPVSPHCIEILEARIAPAAAVLKLGDLNAFSGARITGETAGDLAGALVNEAGDLNGDGFADVVIGAFGADPNGRSSGAVYVIFGGPGGLPARLNLSALNGTNGFQISGQAAGDELGAVATAGDFNGDGFGDLIVGAASADANGTDSGAAYVIFGKALGFPAVLDLAGLDGANGFKIRGEASGSAAGGRPGDEFGGWVGGGGDVNGDGFDDVIMGAPEADPRGARSGAAYVIFGRGSGLTATFDVADLNGANGFKLEGEAAGDQAGFMVNDAGDVNGDGFADVVVGAPATSEGTQAVGKNYVVFGKATGFAATLNLGALTGVDGFELRGESDGDGFGLSVAGAGDLNGDGFSDLVIGAPFLAGASTTLGDEPDVGAAYIVFGRASGFSATLFVSTLSGSTGFRATGLASGDLFGTTVDGAGDLNGDGFDDVVIGAVNGSRGGFGSSYVLFGRASGFIDVTHQAGENGLRGFEIQGAQLGGLASFVSAAGDVDGDGFDDLLIGAPWTAPHGAKSGSAYAIYGSSYVGALRFTQDGRTATFADTDGDTVTVKTSKGAFTDENFVLQRAGLGLQLQRLDLAGQAAFQGTTLSITAKNPNFGPGDGAIDVGFIDATGIDLGAVTVDGDLGKILAGDGILETAGLRALVVGSLGVHPEKAPAGTPDARHSIIIGSLGTFTSAQQVAGFLDVTGALGPVKIGGDLDGRGAGDFAGIVKAATSVGAVTVKGSVFGGSGVTGILSLGRLGKVTIDGSLTSTDPAHPVLIRALGKIGATKTADAVAIAGVNVKGSVLNARILAGFGSGSVAQNADASIGAISVGGSWAASSITAGVADATADGFGRNDTLIGGDTTPKLFASVASLTIKGSAVGSASAGDFFGLTTQRLVKLAVGSAKTVFVQGAADDFAIGATPGNFRAVDFA